MLNLDSRPAVDLRVEVLLNLVDLPGNPLMDPQLRQSLTDLPGRSTYLYIYAYSYRSVGRFVGRFVGRPVGI